MSARSRPLRQRVPLHPLLFAAFPIVFLLQQNISQTSSTQALGPLVLSVIAAAVVLAAGGIVYGDLRRAAIPTTAAVLLFFSYEHVHAGIGVPDAVLLPLWACLALASGFWAHRIRTSLPETTQVLNIVGFALVLLSIGGVASYEVQDRAATPAESLSTPDAALAAASTENALPDVYYLVFDRYGSVDALRERFGFDNSPFVASLEERGFYVAADSRANYPTTAHSIAAAMNMKYLDEIAEAAGPDSDDWRPVYSAIPNSSVAAMFKEAGYRYYHIGSWFDPTASDPAADVNIGYVPTSEFSRLVSDSTLLAAAGRLFGIGLLDSRRYNHEQVLFNLEAIKRTREMPGPRFVFAHILLPHTPFTFDADGAFVTREDERRRGFERGFVEQLKFTNSQITEIVDQLLSGSPEDDPVVVIQADEGEHPRWRHREIARFRWQDASPSQLLMKFGILSAFYLPGGGEPEPYPTISHVNTFRLIGNRYLGADLEMLPDESYAYTAPDRPYDFFPVTDRIRR